MVVKKVSPDQKSVVTLSEIDDEIIKRKTGGQILINCHGVAARALVKRYLSNIRSGIFRHTNRLNKPQHRPRLDEAGNYDVRILVRKYNRASIDYLHYLNPGRVYVY